MNLIYGLFAKIHGRIHYIANLLIIEIPQIFSEYG